MGRPGRDRSPSLVNPGDSTTRCFMKGPSLGPSGEDITWPDHVAARGRKASSTLKPQKTRNLKKSKILHESKCASKGCTHL